MSTPSARMVAVALLLALVAPAASAETDAACPYLYVAPEAQAPSWMRAIVRHRTNVVTLPSDTTYNWIVPLRWGGAKSPDNLTILAKRDVDQKLKAEEFLAVCVCGGRTPLEVAVQAVVLWRNHLRGEAPFDAYGHCPRAVP